MDGPCVPTIRKKLAPPLQIRLFFLLMIKPTLNKVHSRTLFICICLERKYFLLILFSYQNSFLSKYQITEKKLAKEWTNDCNKITRPIRNWINANFIYLFYSFHSIFRKAKKRKPRQLTKFPQYFYFDAWIEHQFTRENYTTRSKDYILIQMRCTLLCV